MFSETRIVMGEDHHAEAIWEELEEVLVKDSGCSGVRLLLLLLVVVVLTMVSSSLLLVLLLVLLRMT